MIRKDRRTGKNRCQEPQLIPQTLTGTRAFKALYALDKQITRNINKSEIETRPVESNGLWCCVLIPAVLISHSLLYPVSPLYKLTAFLSFGLFCYSLLFSLFLYMSCLILYTNLNAGCTVSTLVATLPIYVYTDFGLALALALSVMVILPYSSLLKALLVRFPRTFTVGEAMIISQAIVLFSVTGVIVYYTELFMPDLLPKDDEITFILIYVYTVLSTVGLIVTALYFLHEEDRTVKVLGLLVGAGAIFALIVLHLCLGFTALPEFIYYIFMDSVRWRLFTFWAILLMASAIAVVFHTRGEKASMSDRKTYHVFGTLVFVTGILYDVHFMTLAAGVTSGLIILIEALRLSRIDPISSALQAAFDTYCDEKDCGLLAVTPMYLYFGLSCPLALVPWGGRGGAVQLELLSGVLAIGVGDTAACWLGSRYGVNYWPGSSRTMEGTAANAVVQIIFVYFLHLFEWMNAPYWFLRTAVAAIVTALVEAQVEQVDNLVLPLFSLLAFHATAFLAY